MATGDEPETALDSKTLSRLRESLDRQLVSFALVFGSAARSDTGDESDLDIAVTLDDCRPGDDGYSDTYLQVRTALDDAVPYDVDLVDLYSATPSFARVVLDSGVLVVGSEEKRDELLSELAGEQPTVRDARNRVAAAAERLRRGE